MSEQPDILTVAREALELYSTFDVDNVSRDDTAALIVRLAQAVIDLSAALEVLAGVLRIHWLNSIECLHDIRSDVSHCACGWKSEIQPNVGMAIEQWIQHVLGSATPDGKDLGGLKGEA